MIFTNAGQPAILQGFLKSYIAAIGHGNQNHMQKNIKKHERARRTRQTSCQTCFAFFFFFCFIRATPMFDNKAAPSGVSIVWRLLGAYRHPSRRRSPKTEQHGRCVCEKRGDGSGTGSGVYFKVDTQPITVWVLVYFPSSRRLGGLPKAP